jgi:ferrochelatase
MDQARAPTGVLHVNLGSPAAPTAPAVRAFLDEFLGDPAVVDLNPLLWWLLRKGLVLPRRAPRSAEAYASIWSPQGSPLAVFSRRFCAALGRVLGPTFRVEGAMRYGEPSLARGLAALRGAGARRVVVLSAFPQASRTTSGTIEHALKRLATPDELVFVPAWPDERGYIEALAEEPRAALAAEPDRHLVVSIHGLPVRYVEAGDPYREHCERTARALIASLALAPERWTLAWQSRFGPGRWLEPDVRAVVAERVRRGQRVLVVTPGFTTDCLETLEELGLRLREEAGGDVRVLPCLNDAPRWVAAAAELVRRSS